MQLGLARHGSSFGFKEAVLGGRGDSDGGHGSHAGAGLGSGGHSPGGARKQPAEPVFPPPCAMPPASYQREGMKYQQRAGGVHRHVYNGNGACGHAPPPPSSAHVYCPCGDHEKATEGGCGSPRAAESCPGADARSPLLQDGLGGSGGGDDERTRPRRRRGQRGRRRAGKGVRCDPNNNTVCGLHGVGVGVYGHPGGPNEYGEGMVGPASLECCHDFGGGSSGGGGGGLSNSNGILYRPVLRPAQTFGCHDRSPGSVSSNSSSNGGGSGSGSLVPTSETLGIKPPLELSQGDTSTSFLGVGNRTSQPPSGEVWNPTLYEHVPLQAPTFFGMKDSVARRQIELADQLQQQQQQELRRQQQHLYHGGASGADGMLPLQDLLAISEIRQGLHLLQQEQQHQKLHDERNDERASIVALQLQVRELQCYLKNKTGDVGAGGATPPAPLLSSGLGLPDSSSRDHRQPDGVSSVADRLAALSWGNDDNTASGGGVDFGNHACPQQHGDGVAEAGESLYGLGEDRRGRDDTGDSNSLWGAAPSPFAGFGSLIPASAASQAEVRSRSTSSSSQQVGLGLSWLSFICAF